MLSRTTQISMITLAAAIAAIAGASVAQAGVNNASFAGSKSVMTRPTPTPPPCSAACATQSRWHQDQAELLSHAGTKRIRRVRSPDALRLMQRGPLCLKDDSCKDDPASLQLLSLELRLALFHERRAAFAEIFSVHAGGAEQS